jgi:membrane protease YdiL (CAAX protease family)
MTLSATVGIRQRARMGLLVYFGVLATGSGALEWLLLRAGDSIRNHLGLVLPLMWMPALASLVARVALHEGFADVSFRTGGRPSLRVTFIAWLYPLCVGAAAYGLAWGVGLAAFKLPVVPGLPTVTAPVAAIVLLVMIRLIVGVPIAALAAAGEEFGWRGYMLTRLIDAGAPHPILLSGVIWAFWHLPLVLGGVYAAGSYRLVSAGLFCVAIVAQGLLLARVRLASGSIWPAVVGHSAWNATIQGVFDYSTVRSPNVFWIGESGLLVAVASMVLSWVLVRRAAPCLRAPGVPIAEAAA